MKARLRSATHETFRSLRYRNFRLFFFGQLVSQVGNWLTMVALTLLVLKLTHSGIALGFLAAAQFGPVLLIGPFAGLVADRSDKRTLLLIVQSVAMVQSFLLATLAFMDHPPLGALYAVALLGGFTVAFDNPARRAFVVEMVPRDEEVNNAVSLNSALMTCSRVVGPALAGLLVTVVGYGWTFAADGLSYLAVLAGLWLIDPKELRRPPIAEKGRGQVREGIRYARGVPELWVPLVMMALVGTLAFNFSTVLPLFTIRDLHGSDVTFTLLMSVVSMGSVAGALHAARRRVITVRTVAVASVSFGGAMGLLTFAPGEAVAFVLGVGVGFASVLFLTASTALVQIEAAPEMRGRVLALQSMVFLGSTPIGGPIVGTIAERFGARYSLALGALAAVSAGAFGLASVRRTGRAQVAGSIDPDGQGRRPVVISARSESVKPSRR